MYIEYRHTEINLLVSIPSYFDYTQEVNFAFKDFKIAVILDSA